MSNEEHFNLRKEYNKETGFTAFGADSIVTYVNWLEKRIVKNNGLLYDVSGGITHKCGNELTEKEVFQDHCLGCGEYLDLE